MNSMREYRDSEADLRVGLCRVVPAMQGSSHICLLQSRDSCPDKCRYDPEVLARATACSVRGLAGVPVMVEADVANGLPSFSVVGLKGDAGGRGALVASRRAARTAADETRPPVRRLSS
jgi:hypothetical protein